MLEIVVRKSITIDDLIVAVCEGMDYDEILDLITGILSRCDEPKLESDLVYWIQGDGN